MQTEQQFINRMAALERRRIARVLSRVDRTGNLPQKIAETYWFAGLIEDCGPRLEIGNPYNCYRLTAAGRAELSKLAA